MVRKSRKIEQETSPKSRNESQKPQIIAEVRVLMPRWWWNHPFEKYESEWIISPGGGEHEKIFGT